MKSDESWVTPRIIRRFCSCYDPVYIEMLKKG